MLALKPACRRSIDLMTSKKHGLRQVKLGQQWFNLELRWQADAQMCEDIWQPQGWGNNDRRGKAETVWCFPENPETLSKQVSFISGPGTAIRKSAPGWGWEGIIGKTEWDFPAPSPRQMLNGHCVQFPAAASSSARTLVFLPQPEASLLMSKQ